MARTGTEEGQASAVPGETTQDVPSGGPVFEARQDERHRASVRTVALLVALTVVVALAAGLAWQWIQTRSTLGELSAQNEQLSSEVEAVRSEVVSRDATIADLQGRIVQVRIAFDPAVVGALDQLRTRALEAVAANASEATRAGTAPNPVDATLGTILSVGETEFPVLAEVPGWQGAISVESLRQRQADAVAETNAAIEAEKEAAARAAAKEAAKTASPDYWCVDDKGRRIETKSGCEAWWKRQGAVDPEAMWDEGVP